MNQARIKLTGTDPEKLAYVCDQLKKIAERKIPAIKANLFFNIKEPPNN